ncbi:rhodanese-like domain-containing protein [Gephyromycinifex aptenodytis]|uniref:rhodanese-like domain-containing protein n=1 Tax=Gephyromycinifex aptenodytis TaxID=2716227 RepID=UPI001445904C|nr:rhodanese-like domain-containing protein [Gephyromycinifex aptenodytis]
MTATLPVTTSTATPADFPRDTQRPDATSVTSLVTSLFSSTGRGLESGERTISARAAFQDALYDRTILIDLRPAASRAAEGELPARLAPLLLGGNGGLGDVARLAEETSVTLISSDGLRAERVAALLQQCGLWANAVAGGMSAWKAAGLPLVQAEASL